MENVFLIFLYNSTYLTYCHDFLLVSHWSSTPWWRCWARLTRWRTWFWRTLTWQTIFCWAWRERWRTARPKSHCSTSTSTLLAHTAPTSCWTYWGWSLRSEAYSKSCWSLLHINLTLWGHRGRCCLVTRMFSNGTVEKTSIVLKGQRIIVIQCRPPHCSKNICSIQLLNYTIHLLYVKSRCPWCRTFPEILQDNK